MVKLNDEKIYTKLKDMKVDTLGIAPTPPLN
jgi:hypothetical protein